MFTIKVFICHYAMLCVVNANALTLRGKQLPHKSAMSLTTLSKITASSLRYNTSALNSSGVFSGLRIPSISSRIPPVAHTSHNNSGSSCCFLVQDTIDVRYWAGRCPSKVFWTIYDLLILGRRLCHPYHRNFDSNNHHHVCHSVHRHHGHHQCFYRY